MLIASGWISILHIGMFKYLVVPLGGVIQFEYTFIYKQQLIFEERFRNVSTRSSQYCHKGSCLPKLIAPNCSPVHRPSLYGQIHKKP